MGAFPHPPAPWPPTIGSVHHAEPVPPADWPCWIEGEVEPFGRARVPLADSGTLFGRAVFTTLPLARGRVLFAAAHTARLVRDGAALGLGLAPERLLAALSAFSAHLPARARALRAHLSGDALGGGARLVLMPRPGRPRRSVTVMESPWERLVAPPLLGRKLAARADWSLALEVVRAAGADEVLACDPHGRWVSAASACLFVRVGARVHAPGPAHGALDGIARALLLDAWPPPGCEGLEPVEEPPPKGVEPAEIVLVGSVSGVRAAGSFLGSPSAGVALPGETGALYRGLAELWRRLRRRELARVLS